MIYKNRRVYLNGTMGHLCEKKEENRNPFSEKKVFVVMVDKSSPELLCCLNSLLFTQDIFQLVVTCVRSASDILLVPLSIHSRNEWQFPDMSNIVMGCSTSCVWMNSWQSW